MRPLEFTLIEGEWWAVVSRVIWHALSQYDVQHAEILFLEYEGIPERVQGELVRGASFDELRQLRDRRIAADADDAVVKLIPERTADRRAA